MRECVATLAGCLGDLASLFVQNDVAAADLGIGVCGGRHFDATVTLTRGPAPDGQPVAVDRCGPGTLARGRDAECPVAALGRNLTVAVDRD